MSPECRHIESLQNPHVKQAVKLRKRSYRDETGLLLVEGTRELRRALENGWAPEALFLCRSMFAGGDEEQLVEQSNEKGADLFECEERVLRKIAYRERPEGIVAIGPQLRIRLQDLRLSSAPLLVVAESIEKPGNLGTILRTSDATGVEGVILCDGCTDIHNPNVVRASIGTLFVVPVVEAGSDETREWLNAQGVQIVSATPQGEAEYTEVDMRGPTAIVVGAEQQGLSERWLTGGSRNVTIPMLGQADSLNVAAATSVLLYEALRQRRQK